MPSSRYIWGFYEGSCDLICVLTPSGTHYDIVKKLLESKRNVLVEKPMALHPKEYEIKSNG